MSALVYTYRVNRSSRIPLLIATASSFTTFACAPVDPIFQFPDVQTFDAGADASSLDSASGTCTPRVFAVSPPGCQTSTRTCLRDEFVSPDYCVNRDRNPEACARSIVNNRGLCATRAGGCATSLGCLYECVQRECPTDSQTCTERALDGVCAAVAEPFNTCLARSIESGQCPAYPAEAFVDFVADGGTDARVDGAVDSGVRDTSVPDTSTRDTSVVDLGVPDAAPCFSSNLGQRCSTASTCGGCAAVCQAFGFDDPICCMPLRSVCRQSSDCCAGGGSTRSCSSAGLCCQGPQGICGSDRDCCTGTCRIGPGQSSGLCSR